MRKFTKPIAIFAVIVGVIIGFVLLFLNQKPKNTAPLPQAGTYEYFWGDGCPHCANVQAFLDSWDKKDKLNLDKKEVWSNPLNASLMKERAEYCKIDTRGMGVPFLFTPEGTCLTGDTPIIDYFKSLEL